MEQVNGKGQISFNCSSCTSKIKDIDIQRVLTPDQYDRIATLQCNRYLESLPTFRWCTNPNNCGNGQETEGDIMKCLHCNWLTCKHHKIPMHLGVTCREYDLYKSSIDDEDKKNEEEIKNCTKECPQCKVRINKPEGEEGGCMHMTCINIVSGGEECGHEFCWHCLGPYYGGVVDGKTRKKARPCATPGHTEKYKGTKNAPCGLHAHHEKSCFHA